MKSNKEEIKVIFKKLDNYLSDNLKTSITLGTYDGGSDEGWFNPEEIEELKNNLVLTELEKTILIKVIEDQLGYYSYAFEGSVNGEVRFENNSIVIDGNESYVEWKDRNETITLEDLIKE